MPDDITSEIERNKQKPTYENHGNFKTSRMRSLRKYAKICGSIYTAMAAFVVFYIYISAENKIIISVLKPYSWGIKSIEGDDNIKGTFFIQNLTNYALTPSEKPKFITCGGELNIKDHMRVSRDETRSQECYSYFINKTLLPSEIISVQNSDLTQIKLFSADGDIIDRSYINNIIINLLFFTLDIAAIGGVLMAYTFSFLAIFTFLENLIPRKYINKITIEAISWVMMLSFTAIMVILLRFYVKNYYHIVQEIAAKAIYSASKFVGNELIATLVILY